jgi:hypothetical protein
MKKLFVNRLHSDTIAPNLKWHWWKLDLKMLTTWLRSKTHLCFCNCQKEAPKDLTNTKWAVTKACSTQLVQCRRVKDFEVSILNYNELNTNYTILLLYESLAKVVVELDLKYNVQLIIRYSECVYNSESSNNVDLNNKTLLSFYSCSFLICPLVELNSFQKQDALVLKYLNFSWTIALNVIDFRGCYWLIIFCWYDSCALNSWECLVIVWGNNSWFNLLIFSVNRDKFPWDTSILNAFVASVKLNAILIKLIDRCDSRDENSWLPIVLLNKRFSHCFKIVWEGVIEAKCWRDSWNVFRILQIVIDAKCVHLF